MTLRDHQRLDRLYPALDGDQRIAAVIDSVNRIGTPDPLLFSNIPERQAPLFWHQVGILRAAHTQLGWYLTYVDALVEQVRLRYSSLLIFRVWSLEAQQVLFHLTWHTDAFPPDNESSQEARFALFAKLKGRVDSIEQIAQRPEGAGILELAPHRLFTELVGDLAARWVEVRLGELAVEELRRELGGNDPLPGHDRDLLAGCRTQLELIHAGLAGWGYEAALPEPQPEDLDRLLGLLAEEANR